jgi:glycosyltransferase involved in cell wall biosynthesis
MKKVSVIIPCRNEEAFIGKVLSNVLNQDYPKELLEVFVVDGLSTDATAEIIKEFSEKYSFINYLSNEFKVVPFALNQAIRLAKGEIIVRLDAHAIYPKNYISKLVGYLDELKADNVGGVWKTVPADNSLIELAIAEATSGRFGIGNAHYRLGAKEVKEVDTVPYGCYRRDVFDRIGLFDEELVRNQDDEFNARLIKNGGKIFLVPDVEIIYFARDSVNKMCRMFYQYGLFKPLVNRKLGSAATLRQFAPPMFTLLLFTLIAGSFSNIIMLIPLAAVLTLHMLSGIIAAYPSTKKNKKYALFFVMPVLYLFIHLSYGIGYLEGILRFTILRKGVHYQSVKLSR